MKKIAHILSLCAAIVACSSVESQRPRRDPASLMGYDLIENNACTPDGRFCTYFSPWDSPSAALSSRVKSARRSIQVALRKGDHPDLASILVERAAAGVNVTVLMDFNDAQGDSSLWWQLPASSHLRKYRVPVLRGPGSRMNHRFVVIDGEMVLMSSSEWTLASLAANFGSLVLIKDADAVGVFRKEFEEIQGLARLTCDIFSLNADECGTGRERWDRDFQDLARTGLLSPNVLRQRGGACSGLKAGLFDRQNRIRVENIKDCVADPRYVLFADRASKNESLQESAGAVRAAFGPESDLESELERQLKETLLAPKEAFVFASTNFISSRKIASALVDLHRAGVRVRLMMDPRRDKGSESKRAAEILKEVPHWKAEGKIAREFAKSDNTWAVIKSSKGYHVVVGSAEWRPQNLSRYDDAVVVVEDEALANLFLRNWVGLDYVHRANHNWENPKFQEDLRYLSEKVPCFRAVMGTSAECRLKSGDLWRPQAQAGIAFLVQDPPGRVGKDTLWLSIDSVAKQYFRGLPLDSRGRKWVVVLKAPPNQRVKPRITVAPADWVPGQKTKSKVLEFEMTGFLRTPPGAVHAVKSRIPVQGEQTRRPASGRR